MKGSDPILQMQSPDNAEQALREAYNRVLESGLTYYWERILTAGVNANEAQQLYDQAFFAFEHNHRLLAERWGRAASHFALALWHEAKIQFLSSSACPPIPSIRPSMHNLTPNEDLHLHAHETHEEIEAELRSNWIQAKNRVSKSSKGELDPFFQRVSRYLSRGEFHLGAPPWSSLPQPQHAELLQAERLKAAHEYSSAAEYLLLAWDWVLSSGNENMKDLKSSAA